jgi:hypothetical protein
MISLLSANLPVPGTGTEVASKNSLGDLCETLIARRAQVYVDQTRMVT